MPNIQSAKKKARKDIKRTAANSAYKKSVRQTVKNLSTIKKGAEGKKDLSKAYATIDKAAKRGVIHKNKAARLKSRLSRSTAK